MVPAGLDRGIILLLAAIVCKQIFQNYKNVKLAKLATERLISSDSEIPSAFQNETRLADAGFRGIASLVHKLCLASGEHAGSLLEVVWWRYESGSTTGSLLTGREKLQAER